MILEDYTSFELSKLLKDKGCNEPSKMEWHLGGSDLCDKETGKYYSDIAVNAYTHQWVLKWLREQKGLIINIFIDDDSNAWTYNIFQIIPSIEDCSYKLKDIHHYHGKYFKIEEYTLCVEEALKDCLENFIDCYK